MFMWLNVYLAVYVCLPVCMFVLYYWKFLLNEEEANGKNLLLPKRRKQEGCKSAFKKKGVYKSSLPIEAVVTFKTIRSIHKYSLIQHLQFMLTQLNNAEPIRTNGTITFTSHYVTAKKRLHSILQNIEINHSKILSLTSLCGTSWMIRMNDHNDSWSNAIKHDHMIPWLMNPNEPVTHWPSDSWLWSPCLNPMLMTQWSHDIELMNYWPVLEHPETIAFHRYQLHPHCSILPCAGILQPCTKSIGPERIPVCICVCSLWERAHYPKCMYTFVDSFF